MKKLKRTFITLTAAILLSSGFSLVSAMTNSQTVSAITQLSNTEDFSQITGHDDNHPIWPYSSLGVIVKTDNPAFLEDVKEACDAWSPVFTFHDYGYINLNPDQKINTEKGKLKFVYISDEDLSQQRAQEHNDANGTTYLDTSAVNKKGYFNIPSVNIIIDAAYTASSWPENPHAEIVSTITHELGHALGLRHSSNHEDVMYAHDLDNNLQPDELAAVKRMYQDTYPLNYPDQLTFIDPNQETKQTQSKKAYKGYYFSKRTPSAVYNKLLTHLFLIDDNNEVLSNSNYSYGYRILYHGRRISNRSQLHNGTYTAKIPLQMADIKPSSHSRSLSLVITKDNGYSKGDTLPDKYVLSYYNHTKVNAHSRRSKTYTFYFYFRVHGHYFKVFNKN